MLPDFFRGNIQEKLTYNSLVEIFQLEALRGEQGIIHARALWNQLSPWTRRRLCARPATRRWLELWDLVQPLRSRGELTSWLPPFWRLLGESQGGGIIRREMDKGLRTSWEEYGEEGWEQRIRGDSGL